MVKICPNCGEKNFDDAKQCMHCNTNIKKVEILPDKPLIPKDDEYSYYTPRGYTIDPGVREYFTFPAIICGVISLFFLPILFIPLAFILGGRATIKGDKLGYIAIIIAIISIIMISISISQQYHIF